MPKKITCPVCDRQEIESNICPNCETDLSLIRILIELPPQERSSKLWQNPWLIIFAMLILLLGIIVGRITNPQMIFP